MPPELAAAFGVHDLGFENTAKAGVQSAQGSVRLRQLPTGRAIQVETGQGDRLPSVDTRPPRIRDCDAIIEIVCQGSLDEPSEGNGVEEVEERISSAVEVELSKPEALNNEGECVKSAVEGSGCLPDLVREENEGAEIAGRKNGDNLESKTARSSEESKPRSGTSVEEEVRASEKPDSRKILKGNQTNNRNSKKDDHSKQEGQDRRREGEPQDAAWQRRHNEALRKNRNEDSRIRDRNGSYRDRYEIDKRKKEEEQHARREEPRDRRRRDWEDGGDSRKRNENALQARHREKDGDRSGKGRDRDREREEIMRLKNSNEDNLIRREREAVKNSSGNKKRHRIEENPRRSDNKANSRQSEATENQKQKKRDDNDPKKKEGDRNAVARKDDLCTDEDDENAKRGRSKLERWNSHKEDYGTKVNETESVAVSGENEDRSLDPAEKMKKRTERFNIAVPGEKDTATRSEKNVSDMEVKMERPARKRRWISSG